MMINDPTYYLEMPYDGHRTEACSVIIFHVTPVLKINCD
jgi:hypothetical protein